MKQLNILVAPLDWGLGHATRCIPLIKELSKKGASVVIAADGPIKSLLKIEFPEHLFVSLPAYNIKYSKNRHFFLIHLFVQLPRVIYTILSEHQAVKKVVKKHSIDIVISDNRFGLFQRNVHCIYITHQLNFEFGNRLLNLVAAALHRWFIKKYSACWVPDFDDNRLAGALSRSSGKIKTVTYIGALSRFEKLNYVVKQHDLLVLISGPEPQRTIFEHLILDQLKSYKGSVVLIRGLPGCGEQIENKQNSKQNIILKNHVSAPELSVLIQQATMVICRSGYTTVMDLIKIQQRAILIPTPGQQEQEYLAKHLHREGIFYSVEQTEFMLDKTLSLAKSFNYSFGEADMKKYQDVINDLLKRQKK